MSELNSALQMDRLVEALADRIADRMRPAIAQQIHDFAKVKLQLVAGLDCDSPEELREMRKTVEFGDDARKWFDSEEGVATIAAFRALAKIIATPDGATRLTALERLGATLATREGAEKLATIERFAEAMNETEKWTRNRVMQAAVAGLFGLAAFGAGSSETAQQFIKRIAGAIAGGH